MPMICIYISEAESEEQGFLDSKKESGSKNHVKQIHKRHKRLTP